MSNKQRFLFTSNSLSKLNYFQGALRMITFQGKRSERISKKLVSRYFDVSQGQIFFFGAGRMSVYTFIKALKLSTEDEVIVAGYTCVVLTNAVKFTGCRVKYVDIKRDTLNLNTKSLFNAINANTKLIIVPHNFGIPYEDIDLIKTKYPEVYIMEDAAHTFGSKLKDGRLCGTIGDASFFSLEYSKPLTTGLGGIMLVNNQRLIPEVNAHYSTLSTGSKYLVFKILSTLKVYTLGYFRNTRFPQRIGIGLLRKFGWLYGTSKSEIEGNLPDNYPSRLNYSLMNFLPPQLNRLNQINDRKRAIVNQYIDLLYDFNDIEQLEVKDQILVRFPILFKENVSVETIERIKKEALTEGFNFGVWFNDVVHPAGSFRYCYETGACPEGEFIAERILNLPVNAYYPLNSVELNRIKSILIRNGIN